MGDCGTLQTYNVHFLQQKDNMVEFPEKGHRVRHASSTFYIGRSVPEEVSHVSE